MKLNLLLAFSLIISGLMFTSCDDDDPVLETKTYNYEFSDSYAGTHADNLTATMKVDEMENGSTRITVELENTMDGQTYNIHAHDAADPTTTPNMTPYIESPNGAIFANQIIGNGETASVSQVTEMSFTELTSTYDGFFVVHDPLQAINTADLTTYVIVAAFAR